MKPYLAILDLGSCSHELRIEVSFWQAAERFRHFEVADKHVVNIRALLIRMEQLNADAGYPHASVPA